jgi:predicted MFS family arabinose efflux permease
METIINLIWRAAPSRTTRPKAARFAVCLLFFLNGTLFATWASRVAALKADHHLSNGALGLALLAMSMGAVIAMPLSGKLIVRYGSAAVCQAGALIYCLMLPVAMLAPGQGLLAATLFLFGAGHAALDVAMNAQAVVVEKRYREPIMSSFHALWSIGGLTGAALGGLLASQNVSPFMHFGVMSILFFLGTSVVWTHLLDDRETPVKVVADKPASKFMFSHPRILALGLVALCVMIGEGAMADWSAVYLRNNVGTKESIAAAGYAFFSVAMAIGRLLGDRLTTRFGPVKMVRTGGLLAAVGLAMALLIGQTLPVLIGFACVGFGYATIVPIVFTAAGNISGLSSGAVLASVTTTGYLGFLIGPPLIGFTAEGIGLSHALGLIVLTSLLVAALSATVHQDAPQNLSPRK